MDGIKICYSHQTLLLQVTFHGKAATCCLSNSVWRTEMQVRRGCSGAFISQTCHEGCHGRQIWKPHFFIGSLQCDLCHWVSGLHVSLTGSQAGCSCHGTCPVVTHEHHPHPSSFQYPGRIQHACVWQMRVHVYIESKISRGRMGFLRFEEQVGRVIVQPCVFVRARVHAWTSLLQVCVWVCMHGSSETVYWCNTNWYLPLRVFGIHEKLFMNTSPRQWGKKIKKSTNSLLCLEKKDASRDIWAMTLSRGCILT